VLFGPKRLCVISFFSRFACRAAVVSGTETPETKAGAAAVARGATG
jgi:hypothetical protein